MPSRSRTENVRKICKCRNWKTCDHAWYVDYQDKNSRYRANLDVLTGRHARDFAEAKDEARRAIVARKEGRDPRGLIPTDDPTMEQFLEEYDREKPRLDRWQIGRICKTELVAPEGVLPFGKWRLSQVSLDTINAFQQKRPLVAGNRDLTLLRAAFNWGVRRRLLPRSPFRIGDVSAVRLAREESRSRRLQGDEPERLLAAASSLRDLITAALETGCRKGELLSLQWHQVRFSPRAEIFLPAGKTKAKRDRRVPISSVLAPIIRARRNDPAGEPLPSDAYVFGDEIGRRRHSFKTAWKLTCKRAKIVGLHFHDLRREAGSRWMDAGIPLATIQRWLGHSNISQTSTYLGASLGADELDMRLYEQRIGRIHPLTQIDAFDRPTSTEPTPTAPEPLEKSQQNLTSDNPTGVVH